MIEAKCIVCSAPHPREFFVLDHVPVHCNVQWATREKACSAPVGELRLVFCPDCGHIFNRSFDASRVEYDPRYENSLHFSPTFDDYARELAGALVSKHRLHQKQIVEIGSGKGEFLRLMCSLGGSRGTGFDPSFRVTGVAQGPEKVDFVQDFYSAKYRGLSPDCVVCRQVLEHLAAPLSLLRTVNEAGGDPVVFFEVPSVLFTLRDAGIWDLIYEHVSYFSTTSLRRAFEVSGFRVIRVEEAFGGQFLQIEACRDADHFHPSGPRSVQVETEMIADLAGSFDQRFREKTKMWQGHLRKVRHEGKKVALWGAGSKGVTFLNVLRDLSPADYAVDLNPRKHGLFLPGCGVQIVAPAFLQDFKPDLVLIANPIYESEIRAIIHSLDLSPDIEVI